MTHIDEKFKDARPQDTVERIINLLQKQGIEVLENWTDSGIPDCFSVRVTIAGTSLGANGKGVTKELARASGYAELMERLQSGFLGSGQLNYSDARQMSRGELMAVSAPWLQMLAERIAKCEKTSFSVDELLDSCFDYSNKETTDVIPYYNANDGSSVFLPVNLIPRLYSSNGLAAGNSTEEAIVQGFSEIVERHCHCSILRDCLTPPTIPHSYLKQFSTAYSIICALQDAGYTVIVKDCSLGEGYPVVASAIVDKMTHGYRVIVGSSPVFEIALERSLTEMLQGTSVKTMPMVTTFFTNRSHSPKDVSSALVSGSGVYQMSFFEGEPSYSFLPFPDRSGSTNKELLSFIMEYLERHNRTMLVRDLSHFGFPTYRLIVPGMSEVFTFSFVGKPSYIRLTYETAEIASNLQNATPEQLITYNLQYNTTPSAVRGPLYFTNISRLPLEVVSTTNQYFGMMSAAYAEWELGNIAQCLRLTSSAVAYAPADKKVLTDCLRQFLLQRCTGAAEATVLRQLKLFYSEETVLTVAEYVKDHANPFTALFPQCDENCSDCRWSKICRLMEHRSVKKRVNHAAASFDGEKAILSLQRIFDSLHK